MSKRNPNPTKLELLRRSYKMTRAQLEELSGVNARVVEKYEQRIRDINGTPARNLLKISKVFGVHMEDLMEDEPCEPTYDFDTEFEFFDPEYSYFDPTKN